MFVHSTRMACDKVFLINTIIARYRCLKQKAFRFLISSWRGVYLLEITSTEEKIIIANLVCNMNKNWRVALFFKMLSITCDTIHLPWLPRAHSYGAIQYE